MNTLVETWKSFCTSLYMESVLCSVFTEVVRENICRLWLEVSNCQRRKESEDSLVPVLAMESTMGSLNKASVRGKWKASMQDSALLLQPAAGEASAYTV